MEVMIPTTRSPDFDFNSAISSPCATPRAFGELYSYMSAPTSPNRMSNFYEDFEDEFAFDFSVHADNSSCSAEELFDGGRIKPLKPPTSMQCSKNDDLADFGRQLLSPRSLRSSRNRNIWYQQDCHDRDFGIHATQDTLKHAGNERERGRSMVSSSSRRGARSLSPFHSKESFSSNYSKSSRRWRLRDLLLSRNASEGRPTSKDYLKQKYYSLFFRKHKDVKSDYFRSNDYESSGSVKGSKRTETISAHEMYYNANKAVQKDLKKKTTLPYKQSIWGRLVS